MITFLMSSTAVGESAATHMNINLTATHSRAGATYDAALTPIEDAALLSLQRVSGVSKCFK